MENILELSTAKSATEVDESSSTSPTPTKDGIIGLYKDPTQLQNHYFQDLVNNDYVYHDIISPAEEEILPDNTNLLDGSYVRLSEIADDIVQNPLKYAGRIMNCIVDSDAVYTCDGRLPKGPIKGYDRLYHFYNKSERQKREEHIRSEYDGWNANGSDPLFGFIRWIIDPFGDVIGFTLCKTAGNGRHYMKKRCNGGKVVDLVFSIKFHDVEAELFEDIPRLQQEEAKAFNSEHKSTTNHDATTKFASGLKAGDENWVALAQFLDSVGVDFGEVINDNFRTINGKSKCSYSLSSYHDLTFGKDGKPATMIRSLGEDNVRQAFSVLKKCMDAQNGGKDTVPQIPNSALRVVARLFKSLTDPVLYKKRTYQELLSKQQLYGIIEYKYTSKSRHNGLRHKISELNQSATMKDPYYIGAMHLLNYVLTDLEEYNEKNDIRTYNYGLSNPSISMYLDNIKDEDPKKHAISQFKLRNAN